MPNNNKFRKRKKSEFFLPMGNFYHFLAKIAYSETKVILLYNPKNISLYLIELTFDLGVIRHKKLKLPPQIYPIFSIDAPYKNTWLQPYVRVDNLG